MVPLLIIQYVLLDGTAELGAQDAYGVDDTSCAIDGARRACERTSVCIIAFDLVDPLGVYQLVPKGV